MARSIRSVRPARASTTEIQTRHSIYRAIVQDFINTRHTYIKAAFDIMKNTNLSSQVNRIFNSFTIHHNMLRFITDLHNFAQDMINDGAPNPGTVEYTISLLGLLAQGASLDSYINHFDKNDFFLYTYYVKKCEFRHAEVQETLDIADAIIPIVGRANVQRVNSLF